ncbi:hypothetical protein ACXU4B_03655 [Dyella soli]|uniref:IPTL-CTERM sorting domain-containing protein n=1 Tax=Dyella soli TaxID=522319 RepID=A0A4R0YXB8_9GAMM|nr:hypothetical protein [Dyella soli]TCI10134.1 hypothetical protein EZM97_14540 [Dyella soli]
MSGSLVYVVCDASNIDPSGVCTQVQYVQAPTMLPPLDAASGAAIAVAIIGVWALAAVFRNL